MGKDAINLVFDGPPSHESGRFVEVELDDGRSVGCGEWIERPDGLWALRITAGDIERVTGVRTRSRGFSPGAGSIEEGRRLYREIMASDRAEEEICSRNGGGMVGQLPDGAPEELREAVWTGDGMDGTVRKVLPDGRGWIDCLYSEIKKGDRFIQFPKSPGTERLTGPHVQLASGDARIYRDDGCSWGYWGIPSQRKA